MRAAIALCLSIVGLSAAIMAVAEPAPEHIADVARLVSNANTFQDRVVSLTGVLKPSLRYNKLFKDDGAFATGYPETQNYVELDGPPEVFAEREKYFGAIATVTGRYHHDCLPSSQRLCFDYGGNGIITVSKIELFGYIDAAKFGRDHRTPEDQLENVTGVAPETLDLAPFTEAFVAARRYRDGAGSHRCLS